MMRLNVALYVCCLALWAEAARAARARRSAERPVSKVVRLLQDMQAELEREKEEDEQVFKMLDCWCKDNGEAKEKSIALGEAKMADLKTSMGEYAAKIEELRGALASTREKLRADQKSLDEATAIRSQEAHAFMGEEKELLDAVQACKQALVVLGKHNPSLEQLRQAAGTLEALKASQMARDALGKDKMAVLKAFLQQAEDESQSSALRRVPGFQSYTPQSGQIFGILKQMQEEFEGDLSSAQKEELKKQESFAALREAKQAELEAGRKQLAQLQQDDADVRSKNEQAYEEYTDTREQVDTDKKFLFNLQKRCKEKDEEYEERTKSRLAELQAVQETIAYLSSDDAFDVFERSLNSPGAASFVQTRALARKAKKEVPDDPRVSALVSLARSTAQDTAAKGSEAFAKVNAAIDNMVADLTDQQKTDAKEKDYCVQEMAANERETAKNQHKLENLEALVGDLTRAIEQLSKEIDARKKDVAEMEKEMKKASEIREAEAADFHSTIVDQQLTQAILKKALDRMSKVYALAQAREAALVQAQQDQAALAAGDQPGAPHIQTSGTSTDPGNGPARFSEYEKSKKGGAVLEMLEKIIADCVQMEGEARQAEQEAQNAYESFMKDSNLSIKRNTRAIVNMSEAKAKKEQELTSSKQDLTATLKVLENLHNMAGELNDRCSWLLKNFDKRQEARAAEIDALKEARAYLAGMK
jgi:hypothetical protein